MKTIVEKFGDAAAEHISSVWKKSKNMLHPKQPAQYPASIVNFVHAKVGNKKRLFRIQISEMLNP